MNLKKIFYSPVARLYYVEEPQECTNCYKKIEDVFIYAIFWSKKESWDSCYCKACFNKINGYSEIQEYKLITIGKPPLDAHPILTRPPTLASGQELTVFTAADRQIANEQVIYKTVYSGTLTWDGAQIGDSRYKPDLPDDVNLLQAMTREDKMLYPEVQIDRFLENQKNELVLR